MIESEDHPFALDRATLYVVATPIGNLRDITLRALDVLTGVDCIAAEDTRVSSTLLRRYGIQTKLVALHEHNEREQASRLVSMLADGQSIALISDAGTPGLSDPGSIAVAAVRASGYAVVPIPGPSAVAALMSVVGWPAASFQFVGFLPAKGGARRATLQTLSVQRAALVFYEAPHRIVETIDDLVVVFGGERRVTLGRELTKRFESIHETTLGALREWIVADADRQRGEFALVVEGVAKKTDATLDDDDHRMLDRLLRELPASRAARVAADISGKPRDAYYRRALEVRDPGAADDEQ